MLQAAETRFLRDGYATTTVAAIADEAGVSAETVYKGFGSKAGLVRAIQEAGLAGVGPVPAPERSDHLSEREADPLGVLRGWATLAAEVAPKVSPIMLLVRSAAATDRDMAALLDDMHRQRERRMAHNARRLARLCRLRPGLTQRQARDVMLAYTAPEVYELLVLRQGWAVGRYAEFVFRGLAAELLGLASTSSARTRRI